MHSCCNMCLCDIYRSWSNWKQLLRNDINECVCLSSQWGPVVLFCPMLADITVVFMLLLQGCILLNVRPQYLQRWVGGINTVGDLIVPLKTTPPCPFSLPVKMLFVWMEISVTCKWSPVNFSCCCLPCPHQQQPKISLSHSRDAVPWPASYPLYPHLILLMLYIHF